MENGKMYVVIKKNASKIYSDEYPFYYVRKVGRVRSPQYSYEWFKTLQKIEGKTIEVETEYLFCDQFNTVPIEGVSERGLRIMENLVEKVINDKRPFYFRCQYCGKLTLKEEKRKICKHCGKTKYLYDLGKKKE